jgi:hypothetical protein
MHGATIETHSAVCVQYPLLLSDINETCIFDRFSKNAQIPNVKKIRVVGAELFHADGRTDRRGEANSRFLQFCEHPS